MTSLSNADLTAREETVLAAMAAAGQGTSYSPAQVQKMFFILDREAPHLVGGPHFQFVPYNYGPFDSAVYDELEGLNLQKLVSIDQQNTRYRQYSLTPLGYQSGMLILDRLGPDVKEYVSKIAKWVASVNFQTLISTIYAHYPDMKVNSVFVS